MKFAEKLKELQGQYMFMKYAGGSEYGKLVYVGEDFFQFDIFDITTMEYSETLYSNPKLVLEVMTGGSDIQRIVAEVSARL
ncbi:hypothetical protein IJ818_01985 [bacterium]|nr:hypothetical protein [bacterium]